MAEIIGIFDDFKNGVSTLLYDDGTRVVNSVGDRKEVGNDDNGAPAAENSDDIDYDRHIYADGRKETIDAPDRTKAWPSGRHYEDDDE
jgi:hypothetical protein